MFFEKIFDGFGARSASASETRTSRLAIAGLAFAMTALTPAMLFAAADWTLAKESEGITIHTRPVDGSGIDEFRGVAELAVPVEPLLALLRDSDRFHEWFPATPESKLLERNDEFSVQYSVMDAPWPVSDRDNVLRSVLTRSENGTVEIRVVADPDFHPEQAGKVRVRKAQGLWRLEPLDAKRTRVTFQMHLEPGGGVPEWLINARVVETPFEALGNLRTRLER